MEKPFRLSFDIGGVLSKYPSTFRRMAEVLRSGGAEIFVLTDMPDHEKAVRLLCNNGFDFIPVERVISCDYSTHGEHCKERVIERLGIDVHVDDHPGYCAHAKAVSLFVWPNPDEPYYHDDFVTDPTDGTFGRRREF